MSGILAAIALGTAKVTLLTDTATGSGVRPGNALALCTVDNSGSVTDSNSLSYAWLTGGSPSAYEINATLTSGAVTGDTFGSWLNLGTTRSWSLSRSGTAGTSNGQITLQIRPVGGSVVATAGISFQAVLS